MWRKLLLLLALLLSPTRALRTRALRVSLRRPGRVQVRLGSHRELTHVSEDPPPTTKQQQQQQQQQSASPSPGQDSEAVGQAVWAAAAEGRAGDLEQLLEQYGGDRDLVNWHSEMLSSTPITIAAKHGHARCIEILLKNGGDADICDSMGESPAMLAAKLGHVEALSVLVTRGRAALNVRSRIGATAAYWAAFKGNSQCLQLLIRAGADATIPNSFGVTPLQLARREKHGDCVTLLELATGST